MLRRTALALLLACTALPATAQDVIELNFQHFVSPQSANPKHFIEPWARKVEEESGGRLKINIFPFSQLGGSPREQYDMVRDGVIDGGWVIPGYTPGRFPELEALELPFMTTKSAEEASRAAWIFGQQHLMDDFADVHVIALHMHGPGIVHKKDGPIETVEDFDGLKLRGPSRPATQLLRKLGAVPLGMPAPQLSEALATGVVDGGVITWDMAPSLRLHELTDSHTDVAGDRNFYNLFFIWAMNRDRYEALPDDLRAVIDANSGMMASEWAGRGYDIGDAEARAEVAQSGNAIAVMSEETTEDLRRLGAEVTEEWIAEMTANGLDAAQLVEDARAAVEASRTPAN